MAGFRINYVQVMRQANTISNLAGNLDIELGKLENILDSIGSDWKGPASKEYQKHVRILIDDIRKTKNTMSDVSSTIKNVATKIQQEDERQARLAMQLNSGSGKGRKG